MQQNITVSWIANEEPDLAGYKVYCGLESRRYTKTVDVGNDTQYVFTDLDAGFRYFFAVVAYDTALNVSRFSEEVSAEVGHVVRIPDAWKVWPESFAPDSALVEILLTTDNADSVWIDGEFFGASEKWKRPQIFRERIAVGTSVTIAVAGRAFNYGRAFVCEVYVDGVLADWSGPDWLVNETVPEGWREKGFDDSAWETAFDYGSHASTYPWIGFGGVDGISANSPARWIWLPGGQGRSESEAETDADGNPLAPLDCHLRYIFKVRKR